MHGTYGGSLPATFASGLPASYGGTKDRRTTAGVSQAGTYGGSIPRTYGNPLPGTYDDPASTREPERLSGTYALTLLDSDNNRLVIDNVMSMSATRSRSAVNSLALSVPYADNDLGSWRFSEAILTYDGRTLFYGELREVSPNSDAPSTDLTIYGPAYALESGSLEVTYDGIQVATALEQFWSEYTEFTHTVTTDSGRGGTFLSNRTFEGTPLEILNELHEFGGFEWYVDVTKPDRAYSFPQSRAVREPAVRSVGSGYQPKWDTTDYYNHVVVKGNADEDGNRPVGEARDVDEVSTRGRKTWPEVADLDTQQECEARAQTLLEDFLTNDQLSGSIEMVPRSIDPGTALVIDEWDSERRVGPYSVFFDGEESHIILPPESLQDQHSGSLSMWVKGSFGEATHNPHLFSGAYSLVRGTFRIEDSLRMTFRIGGTDSVVSVDAYPDGDIPRDEWTLVHFDWKYNESNNRTTVRAGHDGTIYSQGGFRGTVTMPNEGLTVGSNQSGDYYEGYIDDIRLYGSPRSEDDYEALALREDIPDTDILSRWTLNEGPFVDHDNVVDIIRGCDGTLYDAEYRGNPLPVEQVQYSESLGEFTMSVDLEKTDNWAQTLAKTQADIRTMRKYE